jgi:hypothetical protein
MFTTNLANSIGKVLARIPSVFFRCLNGLRIQEALLQKNHRDRLNSIQTQWTADLSKLGIQSAPRLVELTVAGSLAVTKMRVESPMLNTLQPGQNNPSEITDQATWNRIARLYTSGAKLDQNSIALIRAKKFRSASTQKR